MFLVWMCFDIIFFSYLFDNIVFVLGPMRGRGRGGPRGRGGRGGPRGGSRGGRGGAPSRR